nr:hypothetical protein [Pandoravirus massiliensis]
MSGNNIRCRRKSTQANPLRCTMKSLKRERHEPHRISAWRRWWSQAKRRCLGTPMPTEQRCDGHDRHVARAWSSLPPEVISAIADHCAIDTLVRLQRTSWLLNDIASRALETRLQFVAERRSGNLHDQIASHFLNDDADGVGALLVTGALNGDRLTLVGGSQCPIDFHAIRAGDQPFDCEVHFGGAFLTMSAVALAVWAGAPRVLALLASTRLGVGLSRIGLLDALEHAAKGAYCRRARLYPVGAMIETVTAMTQPASLLSGLWMPFSCDRSPLLATLLWSAQEAAGAIARQRQMSLYHKQDDRRWHNAKATEAIIAAMGTSPWQLDRLVERACNGGAYGHADRVRALDLVLAAADKVQLVRGVTALVGAGMGPDMRQGVCARTTREAFFALASQEPVEAPLDADPAVDIARATLAQLTMILCDALPCRV